MNRSLLIALGALVAGIVAGIISWQHGAIERLEAAGEAKDREIGEVTAANAVLGSALDALREIAARNDALLADHAGEIEAAGARARGLERQLREALKHEATFDLDTPLPAAVADALCMRWLSVSGYLAGDRAGYAAGSPDAGTGDSVAARASVESAGAGCEGWRVVTWRQVMEWSGLLADHAGLERMDKAALRGWAGDSGGRP